MKLLSLTMALSMLVGTLVFARPAGSTYIPIDPRTLSPKEVITYYSNLYGADEVVLLKMAECESNFNPNAVGDGNRAKNLYQFHRGTFDRYSRLFGQELDYDSYHDQAMLTAWLAVNKPEALNEWTSYRAIKNGGTYSFYSKLLQKHFTVVCKI